MRLLLLILLLANVAFFAWTKYFSPQASPEAQLLQQQINRDAIRLLPGPPSAAADASGGADSAATAAVSASSTSAPGSAGGAPQPAGGQAVQAASAQVQPASGQVKTASACLEWGTFSVADAARAEQALGPLALGSRLTQRRAEEATSWWVYIPAVATRQLAQQTAAELKRLGVQEFFIMSDDAKTRFTTSLGVFHSEEAARTRLDELRSAGVRGAQVGQRETPVQRVYLQVRDGGDALAAKLAALRQNFSGTEVRSCPGVQQQATAGAQGAAQSPAQAATPNAPAAQAASKPGAASPAGTAARGGAAAKAAGR